MIVSAFSSAMESHAESLEPTATAAKGCSLELKALNRGLHSTVFVLQSLLWKFLRLGFAKLVAVRARYNGYKMCLDLLQLPSLDFLQESFLLSFNNRSHDGRWLLCSCLCS